MGPSLKVVGSTQCNQTPGEGGHGSGCSARTSAGRAAKTSRPLFERCGRCYLLIWRRHGSVRFHVHSKLVWRTNRVVCVFIFTFQTYTLSKSVGGGICALEATQGGVFLARAPGSVDVLYPTDPLRSMLPQPIHHERNDPPVSVSQSSSAPSWPWSSLYMSPDKIIEESGCFRATKSTERVYNK